MAFAQVVVIPEQIGIDDIGWAYIDGIFAVEKTPGETIAAGDKVGTDTDKWTAIKIEDDSYGNNDGQFYVIDTYGVSSQYLIIRPRVRENIVEFTS